MRGARLDAAVRNNAHGSDDAAIAAMYKMQPLQAIHKMQPLQRYIKYSQLQRYE
jgi:hypothetical protein